MTSRPESGRASGQPSEPSSLVGQKIGKYEILKVVGRGGMGTVYEALNTAIGKRVAMKFVDADMTQNRDAVARFQREAQAASAVESAHIVEIFDSGVSEEGHPFIVMEMLRGEDLGHRIKRNGRLELGEALHVTSQILRGLHRAHEAGIVHRDLKPDNIFLVDRDDDQNFAKILDFGISKVQRPGDVPVHTLTRQGTVLGTPFYMSPEQAQALADIDGRTDLFSVGAILYECLSGRPPSSGSTYEQVIINICMKDAEDIRTHNPGVPDAIAKVLQKGLARERTDRFQSAREFLDALVAASGGLISSRAGRSSGGDESGRTPTPPGAKTPHIVPASTPSGAGGGNEPTVEVGLNASRVGWSTSGRSGRRKKSDRRIFVLVALGALVVGGVGAFFWQRSIRKASADTTQATDEVEITLKTNAKSARVTANGADAPNGVLRGHKGDVKKVHVEAEGFTPTDLEITLDPSKEAPQVTLAPLAAVATTAVPTVTPAETATADAAGSKPNGGKKPVLGPRVAAPTKTGEPAVKPPTPTPPSTGVAGELKLKTD